MGALLAIETSCDESAVAMIEYNHQQAHIKDALISSQIEIHRKYGGVVPEVACRNHSLNLPLIVRRLLETHDIDIRELDGFAATGGPGLSSSLLIGHSMAKGFSVATQKPFYSVNHMEGHLLSPFIEQGSSDIPPHLSLIISGGHTMLVNVQGIGSYSLISSTLDDAAGEAYDKVGRMLGLPYPAGPEIERHALLGDPKAYNFPRSLPGKLDFSFSGLKTSVLYTLQKEGFSPQNLPSGQKLADLCASFQQAVIDSLLKKTLKAAKLTNHNLVTISGGVSCNNAIKETFAKSLMNKGLSFQPCPKKYTTDNAAMIAFTAWLYHLKKQDSRYTTNINPNLALA